MAERLPDNPEKKETPPIFTPEEAWLSSLRQLSRESGIRPQSLTNRERLYLSVACKAAFADFEKYVKNRSAEKTMSWDTDPDKEAVYRWFQDLYGIDYETLHQMAVNSIGREVIDPRTREVLNYGKYEIDADNKAEEIFKALTPDEKRIFNLERSEDLIYPILKEEDRRYIELLRERAKSQSENDN
jgi:hypothetical protein